MKFKFKVGDKVKLHGAVVGTVSKILNNYTHDYEIKLQSSGFPFWCREKSLELIDRPVNVRWQEVGF